MTTDTMQAAIDHVLRLRGVETPCESCHGMGVRAYPSTAGWRNWAGASKSTKDVCDACWGTGDAERHGDDLRRWTEEENARVAKRALTLLGETAGVGLATMRPAVETLAKELDVLSKAKSKPRPPWFSLVCEQVSKVLREGLEAKS